MLIILLSLPVFSQKKIDIASPSKKDSVIIKTINSELKTKKNADLIYVRNILNSKGYFDHEIKSKDSTSKKTTYKVELNKKYQKINLSTKHFELFETDSIVTIEIKKIEDYLKILSGNLKRKGLLFTEIYLTNIKSNNSQGLKAVIQINKKEDKRYITKINIKGYENFPDDYIKRYLDIKKGQLLNLEDLTKKTKGISSLDFAKEIKPPEILFTKDSTEVFLYIEKESANNFDGIIGFTNDENTKKIKFNGYLNLNLINNLNYGESLNLNYKNDEGEQKNFEAKIKLPYLFKSPVGLEAGLKIFTRDSVFTNASLQANTIYKYNQNKKITLGYESNTSTNLGKDDIIGVKDYESKYITGGINYTTSNNKNIFFKNKIEINIILKNGFRKTEQNKTKQSALEIILEKPFFINSSNVVNIKTSIYNLFSNNYLINELYRFGGVNSIRGFNENSLDGNLNTIGSLEYHYLINNSISINTITDFGYFENDIDGNVFLQNQINHSNIKILFERTVPSFLKDSTYSDNRGNYNINLAEYVHTVKFLKLII